jgi:hypothetical protein
MMPSTSNAETMSQTDEWRAERWPRMYHAGIDILVERDAQEIYDTTPCLSVIDFCIATGNTISVANSRSAVLV